MEYKPRDIEKKWQQHWQQAGAYQVSDNSGRPKYYVLDMFPYPSGAGLHVGHPLGYIGSDIYARFKRLKGFEVLHPMGYDAFGLPAEQYAIEHGVHPAVSTQRNIANFRAQMDNIGFCFDWSREIRTSDPKYYKWTQWIFLQLFGAWFNRMTGKAESIDGLVRIFSESGNAQHPSPGLPADVFSAADWQSMPETRRQDVLMQYRLAYCGIGEVNWCEGLGTVLANDEVVNGVSERGGFPVVKKKLRQWYLRITEYADRLLSGLQQVEFSDAMKEMQSNWIGRSEGAEIKFEVVPQGNNGKLEKRFIEVFTTRPDTIFGVDFMVLAPEHESVGPITTPECSAEVDSYIAYVKSRSERERMAEKKITGCFTGAYVINPFNDRKIPVWISEYVLAGYGTGAIMGVPCGDERDHRFARQFHLPITNIIGPYYNGEEANPTKEAILENSGFLNGMKMRDAIPIVNDELVKMGIGTRRINYKMRDAAFSRQRYWGEPFPIRWKNGVAVPLDESELPLLLPEVETYRPGPDGEGPLANIPSWVAQELETNTMPGYAGSSWYFLRYMDPHNNDVFCSRKASDYWNQVDLYVGGTEHAVGHLLYSRMWTKALFDLGMIGFDEPFRKLLNQGMIQGSSRLIYRDRNDSARYLSAPQKDTTETLPIWVDVNLVDGIELDINALRNWKAEYQQAVFVTDNGKELTATDQQSAEDVFTCGVEVEKMSKSLYNTVNPDDLVERYGADTFRMYEMFLGPIEQSKPWDTKGIEGVHRFLKKLWRLFYDEARGSLWTSDAPTDAELKTLHKTIRKIEDDTERFSFNTAVSAFMVCVNELTELKCHKKEILSPLLVLLAPYAPHIAAELYQALGNDPGVNGGKGILTAAFPEFEEKYVLESSKEYPVSINGKLRTTLLMSLDATAEEAESLVLQNNTVQKWLEGKAPKKIIFVAGKMINVVV